jgi:CRP-like cAMP-binding protein
MPFFREFGDAELWEVLRISRWQDEPAGQTLMREGEPGEFFCIIASGEVAVFKRTKLLNVLGAGECIGEMAYLKRAANTRSAEVSTLSPARVITLRCDDLERASDACRHRFDRAFMSILVDRLSYANTRLSAV